MVATVYNGRLMDFNPRTHKECDNVQNGYIDLKNDFNPRTHKECDVKHAAQN